ncbi:unnamed protein product [Effrenium voratum]|uniref:PH domain-containing protein n=1 Tax=Effrenium voratum TaxID=2562239 RepID=A0AA36I4R4_9DINO|nr:unnamed protein product [Effrenium voratum]
MDEGASALAALRWIWAASDVEKMPGGLQKALGGQWNARYLVLGSHTSCLHWFRDAGPEAILGPERGHVQLKEVYKVETARDDDDAKRRLLLYNASGEPMLTFRTEAKAADAWEKAILKAKARHTETWPSCIAAAYHRTVQPPELLEVDECIEYDDAKLPVMGLVTETQESVAGLQCFPQTRPRVRLLLLCRNKLMRFEPRDQALLGERKGEIHLNAVTTVTSQGSYVILEQPRARLTFKTPQPKEWAEVLKDADAFLCPTPTNGSARSTAGGRLGEVAQRLRQQSGRLLWVNALVVLSVLLQGTPFFYPCLLIANLLVLAWGWSWKAEAPPPLVASAQDLAKALRPMTLGSSEGCVGDGDATVILVRGPGYGFSKKKVASQKAVYALQQVLFLSPADGKYCHVASGLELFSTDSEFPALIVNVQMPDGPPNMMADARAKCNSMVFCFKVAEDPSCQDPALQLLRRFWQDPQALKGKLKVLCQLGASGALPAALQKINGKPALLGKAASVYRGDSYVEVDVDTSASVQRSRGLLQFDEG